MIRPLFALFLLPLAITGCASTKMHSFVDPDFKTTSYDTLLVAVPIDKLDLRDDAESLFVKHISKTGIKCIRALDVLPPTREYEDAEFLAAVGGSGADGMLIVRMTDYYEEQQYVPQSTTSYSSGTLNSRTYYYGNSSHTVGSGSGSTRTYTSGGYTMSKPRTRHEIQLWDVKTGRMAWIGGTFTAGNAYARFNDLMSSLAGNVRKTLLKEGMIISTE